MFSRVIIGIDEHESHADAIALARELVAADGTLTLAHVHVSYPLYAKGITTTLETAERERGKRLLRDVSATSGIGATAQIAASSVGRGLHELVERERADLLVLGSTRQGLLGRVLVGDDTRAALNGAPCAVAVAPAGYAQAPALLREIGVAYNATPESDQALAVARLIAARHDAKLSLFEAVALPMYVYYGFGTPYGDVAEEMLASVRSELAQIDGVEPHVAFGDAAEELTVYSASVDLLVVGSRGFGPLGRLIHSSTSMRLSRSARCPLLILTRTLNSPDSAAEGAGSPVSTTAVA